MVDFHNHILHNVDDGSKNIDQSLNMIKTASDQGITKIIQTVHYQHPKMENKNTEHSFLLNRMNELQEKIYDCNINIELFLGAEVYYLPNLVSLIDIPFVTLGDGKFMLIEFSTNIYPQGYENQFYELQINGITPIVAHPERYRFIQNDIKIIEDWLDRGYLIQVDAGSLLGCFGDLTKKTSEKLIDNSFVHFIGSDAHNDKRRNFCLKNAYDIVSDRISKKYVNYLIGNSLKILQSKDIDNFN